METTGKRVMEAAKVEKRENNIQKANRTFRFFSILCVGAIIFCLLFPHGTFIFLTCTFFLCWLVSLCVKRGKGVVYIPFFVYPLVVGTLFCMAWMLLIIPIMEMIFCKHRPWEYAPEIKYYKAKDESLDYFPKRLPKGAKNVEWTVASGGLWQAMGCLVLAFDTDEAYIERYRKENPARRVDAFEWSLSSLLPQQVELSWEEGETAVVYRLGNGYSSHGYIVVEGSNRLIIYGDYGW